MRVLQHPAGLWSFSARGCKLVASMGLVPCLATEETATRAEAISVDRRGKSNT